VGSRHVLKSIAPGFLGISLIHIFRPETLIDYY
jgi:hypothetical protein